MEAKASAAVMPKGEFGRETLNDGLTVMSSDELASARRIHNPVNGPSDIANIFDGITYDKGAAVLAMFEHYAGEAQWQKGIHVYLTKFARGNATTHDFIQTIADATGHHEIVPAFESYIDQSGIPNLSVALRCGETASLSVVQSMYAQIGRMVPDRQWQVPMCVSGPGVANQCRIVARTADIALGRSCPATVMPNALGKGYYRFAYDAKDWQGLIAAAPQLDPADQRVIFANVNAALHAGHATAADLVALTAQLAPTAKWDLLNAIADTFHELRTRILAEEDVAAYRRFIRARFAPRLTAIGFTPRPHEAPAVTLERAALIRLLVEEGRDPETLARLTRAAEIYVASGTTSFDGLSPDLAEEAMRAAIIAKGADFGDSLLQAYRTSKDDYFHRNVLYAVAASDDPKFLDSVFDMALTPQMRIGDIRFLYAYMGREPAARAAFWSWYKAHYDALLKRVTAEEMPPAVSLLAKACDPDLRDEAEIFFRSKVDAVPGLKRRLDLAEEDIDRCIAFKQAEGRDVRAALVETAR